MAKPCPITREQFVASSDDIVLTGEHKGQKLEITLHAKRDEDKSLGWTSGSIRFDMRIAGKDVPMIGSLNLTCIGSKD